MSTHYPPGCERCRDPLEIVLNDQPVRKLDRNVWIFRCPVCATLILDDFIGYHGHGTIFRATEAMIEEYVRRGGVPEEWTRSV